MVDPAATKVRILKVTTQSRFSMASDIDVAKTLIGLKARNLATGRSRLASFYGGGRCGNHVRGLCSTNTPAQALAEHIHKLGGTLAYAAMDEPLCDGRHAVGPTTCHAEIADIAREIAEGVTEIHRDLPGRPDRRHRAYRRGDNHAMAARDRAVHCRLPRCRGSPLAFLHAADVQWRQPVRAQVRN